MIPEKYKNYMFNEDDFYNENYVCEDPEKEQLVKKLACMITDDINMKKPSDITPQDPDFWILDRLLTKEQVKFMLTFKKKRVVKLLPEEMAERNNMTPEEAEAFAFKICEIGLMEFDRENAEKRRQYFIPKWVVGSGEYMMMNSKLLKDHPEVATFFNYASSVPVGKVARFVPPGGGGLGMHVIPVEKAIEHESKSVSVEHLSHWLKKYDKFCVDVCSCRRQQAMRGEGVGDIEGYMCLAVGDMAEYIVESHKDAYYITYDEVMEILKRSEEKGFVHQITNLDGEDKIVGICNCSAGTCNAIRTSQLFNTPNMSASAYRAHVDKEKCVACGKCVEVCPVGAAKLGQKLCLQNKTEVTYPLTELPDAQKWGVDKWNKNFREDAKLNVYDSGTAPCKTACPVHLSVQGYIQMVKEGRYLDALKLIKQDNPFPAVCGAVCNKRCEDRCTRGTLDKPVAIDEIKKFIAAQELKSESRYIPPCYNDVGEQWDDYKIAIIGGGPAGLSAAFYLRKQGYPVTIFEKEEKPGGMLTYGIPNFRLDKSVIDAEIDVIRQMGAEIKCGVEVGKDITIQQLRDEGYKAFYLAIGLQAGRKANIPNEEYAVSGVDFLREANKEMNPHILSGKTVVIGGGNVAIDVARTAFRAGATEVEMYCLEGPDEMPAAKDEITEAKEEGIVIKNCWGPKEVLVENGKVCGIVMKQCTQVYDKDGKFNPIYDENELKTVPCDHVLLSIGQSAVWGNLLDGTKLETRPNGTVIADPTTYQTSEDDIFAGGDIYGGAKFAIDAIADGREGFVSINRYVHYGQSLTIGRDLREFKEFDRDDIYLESYDNADRQVPGMKSGDAIHTYEDLHLALTEEQVKKEAERCLKCGASFVDVNRCIGCGLCTTRCEFDAISLSRDMPNASKMYTAENGKLKAILPNIAKRGVKILLNRKKN